MRRFLYVAYDVTDLSDDEMDQLAGEAAVQGEASDGHPTVEATSRVSVEHAWKNAHAPACPITAQRRQLLEALARRPADAYLLGAVPEYDEGGDQEAEGCECDDVIVVSLSGADVVEVENLPAGARLEVRQCHADYAESPTGRYVVVASALGAPEGGRAAVTAGPAPRPVEHRGVKAWATVEEYPDDPDRFVTVRFFATPAPRGLDENVYTYSSFPIPGARRG